MRNVIGVVPLWEFLPGDRDFVPADTLHALHHADLAAFGFKDRALLDVQFEHRREFVCAGFLAALVADVRQLLAEALTVTVDPRIRIIGCEDPGEHAGRQHCRCKARTFFVGPVHDLDRRIGLVAGLVQRPHRFERAEHAERAVELAAGRLGVEMRAHGDRRQCRVLARPPREHVADLVNRDRAAQRFTLHPKPAAHLPVKVGQGQPADTAFRRRADLRGFHQSVPQPLRVDLKVLQGAGAPCPMP